MEKTKKTSETRYGIVNFEKRKYPRFNIDLPIEYSRSSLSDQPGRVANIGRGGLLLYLPERLKIGEQLALKLFFPSGKGLETVQTLVQVVWTDIELPGNGDIRTGVSFTEISTEDVEKLTTFLKSLSSR